MRKSFILLIAVLATLCMFLASPADASTSSGHPHKHHDNPYEECDEHPTTTTTIPETTTTTIVTPTTTPTTTVPPTPTTTIPEEVPVLTVPSIFIERTPTPVEVTHVPEKDAVEPQAPRTISFNG